MKKIKNKIPGKNCKHLFNHNGTCVLCGLDLGENFSYQPQLYENWRRNARADPNTGTNLRYGDKGLGGKLPRELRPKLHINRWDQRRLARGLAELDRICELLSLPKTVQEAIAYRYRKAPKFPGVNTRFVLGALVFVVCRQRGISRTYREVYEAVGALGVSPKNSHGFRYFKRLVARLADGFGLKIEPVNPIEYLDRFATKLGLTREETARAHQTLNELKHRHHRKQHSALVLVAVALYASSRLTLREVADGLGVSLSTLCRAVEKSGLAWSGRKHFIDR